MRNLEEIEKDAVDLWQSETSINLSKEMVNNFRRVYMQTKEKENKKAQKSAPNNEDIVLKEDFLDNIVYDSYFEPCLETEVVRVSVDGE